MKLVNQMIDTHKVQKRESFGKMPSCCDFQRHFVDFISKPREQSFIEEENSISPGHISAKIKARNPPTNTRKKMLKKKSFVNEFQKSFNAFIASSRQDKPRKNKQTETCTPKNDENFNSFSNDANPVRSLKDDKCYESENGESAHSVPITEKECPSATVLKDQEYETSNENKSNFSLVSKDADLMSLEEQMYQIHHESPSKADSQSQDAQAPISYEVVSANGTRSNCSLGMAENASFDESSLTSIEIPQHALTSDEIRSKFCKNASLSQLYALYYFMKAEGKLDEDSKQKRFRVSRKVTSSSYGNNNKTRSKKSAGRLRQARIGSKKASKASKGVHTIGTVDLGDGKRMKKGKRNKAKLSPLQENEKCAPKSLSISNKIWSKLNDSFLSKPVPSQELNCIGSNETCLEANELSEYLLVRPIFAQNLILRRPFADTSEKSTQFVMQETYPNSLNPYGKENFILDKISRGSVNTTFNETQKN